MLHRCAVERLPPVIVGFEVAVVEAVKQEIKQIRHYSLGTLGFQKLYHVVVC